MRRYLFSAATAGTILALAGCGAGDEARTVTVERTVTVTADGRPFARPDPDDGIAEPAEPTPPESPPPPANGDDGVPDPDPGPLPLDPGGAARVLADLRAAVGATPQFTSIGFYDGYAVLYVRDPAKPGNVDRYVWRDGAVSAGSRWGPPPSGRRRSAWRGSPPSCGVRSACPSRHPTCAACWSRARCRSAGTSR